MKTIKKILLAEDELLVAKVLRIQFEKDGIEVQNVADAESAFKAACESNPDFILMDIRLKNNTSGIDAARNIRAAGINTPIIFTTGNSHENTIKLVADISNNKVLIKPVEYSDIMNCLKTF